MNLSGRFSSHNSSHGEDYGLNQKTLTDVLHQEGKKYKIIGERVLNKSIFLEREVCDDKRWIDNRDDHSLEKFS